MPQDQSSTPKQRSRCLSVPKPLKSDLSLVLQRGEWKPYGRNTDASGNVPRLQRRHGQNERGIGIGRKNWLFAGSDKGGERIANILSIIETAKLHGHNPEAYLTDVLARIQDHPKGRLENLLPWNWTPANARCEAA
jgi:hypothetical protein